MTQNFDRNQILFLFLLSFLVRLIGINDYLFFGFKQGRDLQIIQKIYQLTDLVLVGPSTSIGGIFHGPWYYYLLSLPLGLTGGNPQYYVGSGIGWILLFIFTLKIFWESKKPDYCYITHDIILGRNDLYCKQPIIK